MEYSQIRAQARATLRGKWALAVAVTLVAYLLGGAMTGASFLPEFTYQVREEYTSLKDALLTLVTVGSQFGGAFVSANLFALAQFILGGAVQLGYAEILLKQEEGQSFAFLDLFSQFHRFGQGFAQRFLRGLYTFLWSLLFIIPGIVKSYSYAMTPFIMADYPQLSASEAIDRSKEMMDGHKGDLFLLDLSFIGWDLLAALTMNVGHLALNPWKNAAHAVFYRKIAGYPKVTIE